MEAVGTFLKVIAPWGGAVVIFLLGAGLGSTWAFRQIRLGKIVLKPEGGWRRIR